MRLLSALFNITTTFIFSGCVASPSPQIENVDKINSIVRSMRKEQHRANKFFSPNFEDSIDEVLSYNENKNILDYFNEYIEVDLPNIYNNISPEKWDKQGNDELPNFTEIIGDNWILYNSIFDIVLKSKKNKREQ